MNIRLILCLLIPSLGMFSCKEKPVSIDYPNIIYILADDMGYGDVSAFNSEGKIVTKYLDKLAEEGMTFTDAHTTSSVCTPTRYAILTGRYSWRSKLKSGVLTGKSKALIPSDRMTVPSMLQSHGYETAFIGKWHLGWDWATKNNVDTSGAGWNKWDFYNLDFSKPVKNSPNDLGFDYFYGHAGSLDMAPYVYVENGHITATPDTTTVNTGKYSWWREGPTAPDFIHADVTPNFFRRAYRYLTEQSKKPSPFFLYLSLPSPHTPILPTDAWQNRSGLNPYADFVMMIDGYIGELSRKVAELGMEDNTLIIFTTDNGCSPAAGIDELEQMGHYPSYVFRGHKADIYEGGHRVPFIAKWPAIIEKGSTNDRLISTSDLMGTLADLLDYTMKENEGEDSYSMLPLFRKSNSGQSKRREMIHHSIDGSFAIRKNHWKLIMTASSGGWSYPRPGTDTAIIASLPPVQLYNLSDDPSETINLSEKYPDVVKDLRSTLIKHILNGRSTPGPKQSNDTIDFDWNQIAFVNNGNEM